MLVMPEFIGRFLVEAIGEGIGAALVHLYQALPRPVRTFIRILGYLLLVATYLITFLVCALAVAKGENVWLRIGAGLLGGFCLFELVSLMRKAFKTISETIKRCTG
jgi:hypothetical protein